MIESPMADFAKELPPAAGIVVNILIWRVTKGAYDGRGDGFTTTGFDGFHSFAEQFKFTADQFTVILLLDFAYNRWFIDRKKFVFRAFRIPILLWWSELFDNEKKLFDFR
jgi:hypothetical protein